MLPTRLIEDAGPLALLAWPIAVGVAVLAIVFTALSLARFRVPAPVWWAGPLLVLFIGALSSWLGLGQGIEAVLHASADMQGTLAMAAVAYGMYGYAVALFAAPLLFMALALGAALGTLNGGPGARFTVHGVLASAVCGLGTIGTTAAAMALWGVDAGPGVFALGGVGLWMALCYFLAGLRLPGDPTADAYARDEDAEPDPSDAPRIAAQRALVVTFAIAATWTCSDLFVQLGRIQAAEAIAHASAEMKMTLLAAGMTIEAGMGGAGWLALAPVALGGLVLWLPVMGRSLDSRGLLGAASTVVLALPTVIVLLLVSSRAADLYGMSPRSPHWVAALDQQNPKPEPMGYDLPEPSCLLIRDGGAWAVAPQPELNCPWREGPAPLPLDDARPLSLAVPGTLPAKHLLETAWTKTGRHDDLAVLAEGWIQPDAPRLFDPLRARQVALGVATLAPSDDGAIAIAGDGALVRLGVRGSERLEAASYDGPDARSEAVRKLLGERARYGSERGMLTLIEPGPAWTVQDVLDWCGVAPDPDRCLLVPAGSNLLPDAAATDP